MVVPLHKYDYAIQLLQEKKVQLLSNGQQILNRKPDFYFKKVKPPKTILYVVPELLNSSPEIVNISYGELMRYGFRIYARKSVGSQKFQIEYFLSRTKKGKQDYGGVPPGHKIELNRTDYYIRLVGSNVQNLASKWLRISDWHLPADYYTKPQKQTVVEDAINKSVNFLSSQIGRSSTLMIEGHEIEHIPIMETDDGGIVCIPKENDPPTIGLIGERGSGKTLGLHRFENMFHYRWDTRNIIMNDLTGETAAWSKPWQSAIMGKEVSDKDESDFAMMAVRKLVYYNESPQPMPMVFLHPEKNPPLTIGEIKHPYTVGVKISLPFKQFMEDFETVMKGHSTLELGKSGKYFREAIKNLPPAAYSTDFDVFIANVKYHLQEFSEDPEGQVKIPDGVQSKIMSIVKDLYNANFLDISNGVSSKWKAVTESETYEDYPWLVLMRHGITPSLQTHLIYNKSWFPQYFRFMGESILNAQLRNPLFKDGMVMLFIPEITGIASSAEPPNAASEILEKVFAEGRNMRVGAVYDTQNYELLPNKISTNTHYLFVFRQKRTGIEAIRKDYLEVGLNRSSWRNEIMGLKPHECVALTSKYFIKYEINGRWEKTSEPQKGKLLPPISKHISPNEKL